MRAAWPRLLLAVLVLCGVALLAGCGKGGASASAGGGGPTRKVAPVTPAGAVSVVTRNTTRLGGADAATDAAAVARAVYPGLTSGTRPQLVVLVDERNWPAALAASELAGAPLNAPLIFSEGNVLPAVSREALEALDPLGASALGGTQVLRIGTAAPVPKGYLTRSLSVGDAPVTSAALERLAFGEGGATTPHQVIVVPTNAARALQMPAAGLAAESVAPILFVTPGRVPAATASVLVSLHRPSIYVMDGVSLGRPALAELGHLGAVHELNGPADSERESPSANAIAVARFTDGQFGWGVKEPGHGLVFANAAKPLDAPAAALLSATGEYAPLLLLEGATQIPGGLSKYLGDIQPAYADKYVYRPAVGSYNHGWLIGNEHVISGAVQAELDSVLEISPSKQTSEASTATPAE
jgi:ell wall binding domain 2 (CWB2)